MPFSSPEVEQCKSRWDETVSEAFRGDPAFPEPEPLEILYARSDDPKADLVRELVYVDNVDDTQDLQGPRLLVPVQAISALKCICEAEFKRFQATLDMLNRCRLDYSKQLQCMRDKMLANALRPDKLMEKQHLDTHVHDYEVYFYNPPDYVNEEMREYLQMCIRFTNKDVIEENFRLVERLKALGADADSDPVAALVRKMGPGNVLRKMYAFVNSAECPKHMANELALVVQELFPREECTPRTPVRKRTDSSAGEEKKRSAQREAELTRELEELRKKASIVDELKAQMSAMQANQLDLERLLASERARADAEQSRADSEQERAEKLETDVRTLQSEAQNLRGQLERERQGNKSSQLPEKLLREQESLILRAVPSVSKRILGIASQIATSTSAPSAAAPPAKVEAALAQLEESISSLEGAWKADQARRALADQQKRPRTPRSATHESDTQTEKWDDSAVSAQAAKNQELLAELDKMDAELERLKARLKAKADELKQAQEALDDLYQKLELKDEQIRALKSDVRRLKSLAGEPIDDIKDEDDDDIPDFLRAYWKRAKGSRKKRWQLLNQDAACQQVKRTYYCSYMRQDAREARAALSFLHSPHMGPKTHKSSTSTTAAKTYSLPKEEDLEPLADFVHSLSQVSVADSNATTLTLGVASAHTCALHSSRPCLTESSIDEGSSKRLPSRSSAVETELLRRELRETVIRSDHSPSKEESMGQFLKKQSIVFTAPQKSDTNACEPSNSSPSRGSRSPPRDTRRLAQQTSPGALLVTPRAAPMSRSPSQSPSERNLAGVSRSGLSPPAVRCSDDSSRTVHDGRLPRAASGSPSRPHPGEEEPTARRHRDTWRMRAKLAEEDMPTARNVREAPCGVPPPLSLAVADAIPLPSGSPTRLVADPSTHSWAARNVPADTQAEVSAQGVRQGDAGFDPSQLVAASLPIVTLLVDGHVEPPLEEEPTAQRARKESPPKRMEMPPRPASQPTIPPKRHLLVDGQSLLSGNEAPKASTAKDLPSDGPLAVPICSGKEVAPKERAAAAAAGAKKGGAKPAPALGTQTRPGTAPSRNGAASTHPDGMRQASSGNAANSGPSLRDLLDVPAPSPPRSALSRGVPCGHARPASRQGPSWELGSLRDSSAQRGSPQQAASPASDGLSQTSGLRQSQHFQRAASVGVLRPASAATPAAASRTGTLRPSSSSASRSSGTLPLTNAAVSTVLPGVSPALLPGRVRKGPPAVP